MNLLGKKSSPNAIDIVARKTNLGPYDPAPLLTLIAEVRKQVEPIAQKASLLDVDTKGTENFVGRQRELAAHYQHECHSLENHTRARLRAAADLIRSICADLSQAAENIVSNPEHNMISQPVDEARNDIRTTSVEFRSNVKPILQNVDEATANRNAFHRDHPVAPPSRHARAPLTRLAWIIAAVCFEILVNGYFFINATDGGLIGSLFEVVLFAPINVAVAVFLGLVPLRYGRHRNQFVHWSGVIGTAACIALIFSFNIYLSAIRLSLKPELGLTIGGALSAIFHGAVFAIADYQALGVFVAGLVCAFLATLEAFHIYDPYPGYTTISRRFEEASEDLRAIEGAYAARLKGIGKKYELELAKRQANYTSMVADLGTIHGVISSDLARYEQYTGMIAAEHDAATNKFFSVYVAHPVHQEMILPESGALAMKAIIDPIDSVREIFDKCDRLLRQIDHEVQRCTGLISDLVVEAQEDTEKVVREARQQLLQTVVRPSFAPKQHVLSN